MRRRHVLALALLATLAAAPAAQAKQVNALTVCGADGCREAPRAIGQALHDHGWAASATRPRPAPHFRFILGIGDDHQTFATDRLTYVPSTRAIGGQDGWWRVDRGTAAKIERALAKRRPLPAAKLRATAATVAERGASPPPAVASAPTDQQPAASDGGLGWWALSAATLAAMLALSLWRLRRGRVTAVGRRPPA